MADPKKEYDSINRTEIEDDDEYDSKPKYTHTHHSKWFYAGILFLALAAKSY